MLYQPDRGSYNPRKAGYRTGPEGSIKNNFWWQYNTYNAALELTGIDTLETRSINICFKFAILTEKHSQHKNWLNQKQIVNKTKCR